MPCDIFILLRHKKIIHLDKYYVTVYSYIMSKKEKLMRQEINNPQGLSFEDFKTLLSRCDWVDDHQTGSYSIWYSPKRFRISIQNKCGMAKGYQVKQFLAQYDEENKNE